MPYYNNVRVGGAMDADHIYYNINVSNDYPNVTPTINEIPAVSLDTRFSTEPLTFNQSRAQPYLINPSEYFVSVQRFSIESPNLPVFIAQPLVGASNINTTIYSMAVRVNGTTIINIPILWQQQDTTFTQTPASPVSQEAITSPYYYCYSYQWFLKCINDSIITAMSAYGRKPSISFNPVTNLFRLHADVGAYRTSSTGATIGNAINLFEVYMNTALYNLFSSFPAIYRGSTIATGLDYQLLFTTGSDVVNPALQPYIINVIYDPTNNRNDVFSTQEYITLPLWTPVKSIVFRCSLLNVVADMIATPVVYENNVNINAGQQNTDILPVLIEYSVPLNTGTEYKPYILYEPTGEYRLSDLYSDIPVYGLQFDVFWKDSFGNLNNFFLGLGSSATLKILFRKKSFNSDQI
jgi:hypothetical protein